MAATKIDSKEPKAIDETIQVKNLSCGKSYQMERLTWLKNLSGGLTLPRDKHTHLINSYSGKNHPMDKPIKWKNFCCKLTSL